MTTSRSPLLFAAALLLWVHPAAPAATLGEGSPQKPSPAQTQPQNQTQAQAQTSPIFSLGTISIAPSGQCFAGPAPSSGGASKPRPPHPRSSARRSRHVADPVPPRIYSRA